MSKCSFLFKNNIVKMLDILESIPFILIQNIFRNNNKKTSNLILTIKQQLNFQIYSYLLKTKNKKTDFLNFNYKIS